MISYAVASPTSAEAGQMQVRILGSHNGQTRDTRFAGYLVDGVLALDAGTLTRALTADELRRIKAVLLSHRHYDHCIDLWPLAVNARRSGTTIDVFGIPDTMEFVAWSLIDSRNTGDFTKTPSPQNPVLRHHRIETMKQFPVLDYKVTAMTVPHGVPGVGYSISDGKTELFYTGDTGEGMGAFWKYAAPQALLTEVTYDDANADKAAASGHITPRMLGESMAQFKELRGFYPPHLRHAHLP
ncbi:MAG: hypothetical protein FJ319_08395 [SAR202 cluster bacterium]|nr:hypothetical protein [SAR202 cluster bacterium]